MPWYFEVVAAGTGAETRPATIAALPARVEAMGRVAAFAPTEEDLRQLERRLAEQSRDRVLQGLKVVWRVSDDGNLAEAWEWPSVPEPAPHRVRDA
jgi:hypothetical protein